MAKITDLPPELLAMILQRSYFTNIPLEKSFFRNPLRMSLVCRAWKELAQKMLLYNVCLSEHNIVGGIRSGPGKQFVLYPHLAKWVRVLYLSFHSGSLIRLEENKDMGRYLESLGLVWLESVLKDCSDLKALHVEEILGAPRSFLFVLDTVSPTLESLEWSIETEPVDDSNMEAAVITLDELWGSLERHSKLNKLSITTYSYPTPILISEVSLKGRRKIQLEYLELYFHLPDSIYNWTSKILSLTDSTTLQSLQITLPEATFDFNPDVIDFTTLKALTLELESDSILEQQKFYLQILKILPQCLSLTDLNLLCATSHKTNSMMSTQLFNSIPVTVEHLAVEFCDQQDSCVINFWLGNKCPNLVEFRTMADDSDGEEWLAEQNLVTIFQKQYPRIDKYGSTPTEIEFTPSIYSRIGNINRR